MSETNNVVFVNVTTQCNVDCARCYLTKESRKDPSVLLLDDLEKLLSHEKFQLEPTCIAWEGGELTLIGEARFRAFLDLKDRIAPNATQGLITNLFALPEWLIRVLKERPDMTCETTFALSKKANLAGDEVIFQENFKKNLARLNDAGIDCPVNIELNRETFERGPAALVEYILSTNQKNWDIDTSCDFPAFLDNPNFINHYPIVPATITHKEMSNFLREIYYKHWFELKANGVIFDPLFSMVEGKNAIAFNAGRDEYFFSINPDGSISSDALFSDLPETFIGNIRTDSVDQILNHPRRKKRMEFEKEKKNMCSECDHIITCGGGASHVALHDGSGECSGSKRVRDLFSRG